MVTRIEQNGTVKEEKKKRKQKMNPRQVIINLTHLTNPWPAPLKRRILTNPIGMDGELLR